MTKDEKNRGAEKYQRPYVTPKLTEFGSIAALTRNNTLSITPEGNGTGNQAKKIKKP
jgi:hypothetical protein